ncbi:MAG: M48 family metalloprotease [Waddliaceae bacterium]
MNRNQLRTVVLLSLLTGLLLFMGYLIGGNTGILIAFILSLIMNFSAYYQADKYALRANGAQPLSREKYPHIYRMVAELAEEYRIPMPKLWVVPTKMANAFATGRNPKNGHVAVTYGIMEILEPRELRAVLAHELGHIKNRDILVSSIAVTIAGAIGMVANSMRWQAYGQGNRGGGLGALLIAMLLPFLATIIHLGISRSREYMADESGAHVSEDPLALASALQKLDAGVQRTGVFPQNSAQASTASLFIVYPFTTQPLARLFSTHPPMEERIERLMQIAKEMQR